MYEDLKELSGEKLLKEFKSLQNHSYLGNDASYMIKIKNYREEVEKELLFRLSVFDIVDNERY
jgi:hypothetical protein